MKTWFVSTLPAKRDELIRKINFIRYSNCKVKWVQLTDDTKNIYLLIVENVDWLVDFITMSIDMMVVKIHGALDVFFI